GIHDGRDDLHVAATAAEIPGQVLARFLLGRVGVFLKQRLRGQDEAGRTVRALKRGVVQVRLLDDVKLAARPDESFDGYDLLALGERRQQQAATDRLAVCQDGAGA